MNTIKNYDSRSSISTYALGDVCACYIYNARAKGFTKANKQNVKSYAKVLGKVIKEQDSFVFGNGKYHNLTRAVGIVVDKLEATTEQGVDMITVMFKTSSGDYVLNKYAVGVEDVSTNGKEYVRPTVKLNISTI